MVEPNERVDDTRPNTKPLSVSIIIPVFGPQHFLDECLDSLRWSCSDTEVICVDNGTEYPMKADCVIRNHANLGYAKACNQGAAMSIADILVMLNVDTVGTMDWLANLIMAFDDPGVMIAGPRIIHPNGSLQTAGVRTWHGCGSAGGEEIKDDLPTRDVDGVTGACMAIRRDAYNKLGGMCQLYQLGYEDVELCLSAREVGYRIRYVNTSTIIHHESATGPERWAHTHENVALMNKRWGNR